MGRNNPGYEYALWCNASPKLFPLEVTIRERDLGVIITLDMQWHEQTCSVASKANQVLGMQPNAFTSRDRTLWKTSLHNLRPRTLRVRCDRVESLPERIHLSHRESPDTSNEGTIRI